MGCVGCRDLRLWAGAGDGSLAGPLLTECSLERCESLRRNGFALGHIAGSREEKEELLYHERLGCTSSFSPNSGK